jgi:hypothetical protein
MQGVIERPVSHVYTTLGDRYDPATQLFVVPASAGRDGGAA